MNRDRATLAAVSVKDLDLPTRVLTVFAAEGIETLADVVTRTEAEVRRLDNIGAQSIVAIKQALVDRGLRFGIELDPGHSLPGQGRAGRPAAVTRGRSDCEASPSLLHVSGGRVAPDRPLGAPVSPTPRPAADLNFGDDRFGYAIGRPGL